MHRVGIAIVTRLLAEPLALLVDRGLLRSGGIRPIPRPASGVILFRIIDGIPGAARRGKVVHALTARMKSIIVAWVCRCVSLLLL